MKRADQMELKKGFEVGNNAREVAKSVGLSHQLREQSPEELHQYAVELQLQHDELLRTRAKAESSRKRFEQLFQLAPLAQIILGEDGRINRANGRAEACGAPPAT